MPTLRTIFILPLLLAAILVPTSVFAQAVSAPDPDHPFCVNTGKFNATLGSNELSGVACFRTQAECDAFPAASRFSPSSACKQLDTRTGVQKVMDSAGETLKNMAGFAFDEVIGRVLKWIANAFFYFAGFFMNATAVVLDHAIEKSISSGLLSDLTIVSIGWTIVRDACNMVFLFILLYIAIMTILGMSGGREKRMIASVIISVILINFSLFFTKVVIDAGNVVAKTFWDKMLIQQGSVTASSFSSWALSGGKIQTTLDPESPFNTSSQQTYSPLQLAMIYAGGAIVMFVMGYVFLAGAILMAIRIIGLIFVMIFSPFAILGLALPRWSYFDKWMGSLIQHTFSAPILIFMLYLITQLINSTDLNFISGGIGKGYGCAFSGTAPECYAIIFHYIILVGLILTALKVSISMSGSMGAKAGAYAKLGIGYAGGAGAAGARQLVGRAGRRITQSDRVQKLAAQKGAMGSIGRGLVLTGDRAQNANFDIRGSKLFNQATGGGFGTAGTKGYRQKGSVLNRAHKVATLGLAKERGYLGEDKEKAKLANLSKFTEVGAKEEYLRDNLGTGPQNAKGETDRYDIAKKDFDKHITDAKKDIKKEIDADKIKDTVKENAEKFEDAGKEYTKASEDLANLQKQQQSLVANNQQAQAQAMQNQINQQKQVADDAKKVVDQLKKSTEDNLRKMAPGDIAELDKDLLKNKEIQRALPGKGISALNKAINDGKITDPELIENMTKEVLRNGTDDAKSEMRKLARSPGSAFTMNFAGETKNLVSEYENITAQNKGGSKYTYVDPKTKQVVTSNLTNDEHYNKEISEMIKMMGSDNTPDLKDSLTKEAVATKLSKGDLAKIEKSHTEAENVLESQDFADISRIIQDEYHKQTTLAGKLPKDADPRLVGAYNYIQSKISPNNRGKNPWNP